MIKNDFRYIIKKIIIGLGIFIGIFYFKSCQVSASNIQHIEYVEPLYNYTFSYDIDLDTYEHYYLGVYYTSNEVQFQLRMFNGNVTYKCAWESNCNPLGVVDYTKNSRLVANRNNNINNVRNVYLKFNRSTGSIVQNYVVSTDTVFYEQYFINRNLATMNPTSSFTPGNFVILLINYDLSVNNNAFTIPKSYYNDNNMYDPTPPVPIIESLHAQLNKTESDMLVSVTFSPEFTYVDTDNYKYYAWFEGQKKFLITENNVVFNTQSNTVFHVEITDLQGNTIDSETYTVSSIGLIYNGNYDIQFTSQEWTQSDSENNSDVLFDVIDRVDIDTTYIPSWINLKYQYQFVPVGSSLDSNSWVLLNNNSSVNNFVYTTHTNGVLYARILDNNNNILKSSTFQVTRIGELKNYNTNKDDIFFSFNKLKDMTNFGGPISGLIVLPVNVLQAIFDASNKVCTPYNFGSIGGHNITFPCIDIEHYIGSALWTTIDLIFSGCMFFAISKWFTSAYYNFIMLDNTPGIKERRDM